MQLKYFLQPELPFYSFQKLDYMWLEDANANVIDYKGQNNIFISTTNKNKVRISCADNFEKDTYVSIYNIVGQKLINETIVGSAKEFTWLMGFYVVYIHNKTTQIQRKIRIV